MQRGDLVRGRVAVLGEKIDEVHDQLVARVVAQLHGGRRRWRPGTAAAAAAVPAAFLLVALVAAAAALAACRPAAPCACSACTPSVTPDQHQWLSPIAGRTRSEERHGRSPAAAGRRLGGHGALPQRVEQRARRRRHDAAGDAHRRPRWRRRWPRRLARVAGPPRPRRLIEAAALARLARRLEGDRRFARDAFGCRVQRRGEITHHPVGCQCGEGAGSVAIACRAPSCSMICRSTRSASMITSCLRALCTPPWSNRPGAPRALRYLRLTA